MQKRLRQLAGLTLVTLAPSATLALASQENVAEVLQRQTQELLDAVSSGSASVWERYRGPDGRITGFKERREAWDLDWTRLPE